MGCDIHVMAQRKGAFGWEGIEAEFTEGPEPFYWRNYGMFAFLAGVRNYSAIAPISGPRGLPDDAGDYDWLGDHSFSWLSVEELASFNYDASMEDRRYMGQTGPNSFSGALTAEPGEGKITTYRDFLGQNFFKDLIILQEIGAERIIFGFDS
jgi:hypothetical protein